jgi:hypothetical protein
LRTPSQVPVGAEDEDSTSSYRFPLLETFESPPHECNKRLNFEIHLNTVYDISLIFVYHMCVN